MKRELTFDNFFIHDGNKVAYLAAQKVIEFPGELFNPFYVYGDTGIGKTHLLRAIFNEFKKKKNAYYFSGKEFEKQLEDKKEFDVPIIVDDLHLISNKYYEMLLSTIDTFLANNRQICFSGTLAPRDLQTIGDKLRSRLEGGLVCDIQPPKELALVDMIKKKSEEAGIILPDDIALELAQVSTASIRTIEGMINRLVAYSSLGNLSLDTNSVRLILKEFYPKGIYSPVSSLLEELKKNATEVLQDVSEKMDVRDEYRERIYIWEMKGFDTSSLKDLIDGDIEILKKHYDDFIAKVERLVQLQKEFGALETSAFPDQAMRIESMLFSPDHVDEIEKLVDDMREKTGAVSARRTFETFIVGESNKTAVTMYREQIAGGQNIKFNPFVIFGKPGTGKTHFLEAVYSDLKSTDKAVSLYDVAEEKARSELEKSTDVDIVILDNFHSIFSASPDIRKNIFTTILSRIKKDQPVILASNILSSDVSLADEEKTIFELGLEVELATPSPELVETYIKTRLGNDPASKIISEGLPEFASFTEIDEYLDAYHEKKIEAPAEVIPLGLPGEEPVVVEEEERAEKEEVSVPEEKYVREIKPLKALRHERFIFPDIPNEFIEERY
jgi:chromosomal replication initiation ATPase DnaA